MKLQSQITDMSVALWQVAPDLTTVQHTTAIVSFQQASTGALNRLGAFNLLIDQIMSEDADLLRELARR